MTDKTDSKVRESLSAMVDNEASEFELFRTTKMLSEDDELRQAWHRYHLASSVMGTEGPIIATDLSAQIASAIELETELSVPTVEDKRTSESEYRAENSSSNTTFSKIAIAASVAVVAVFGVQFLQLGPENIVNAPSNELASKATNEVDVGLEKSDGIGPQFQLPSGYSLPHVNIRAVSTAPVHSINQPLAVQRSGQAVGLLDATALDTGNMVQEQDGSETHRQVEHYLNRMMLRHTQQ
jgi:sigma-E factor negative regulatory protein RseA